MAPIPATAAGTADPTARNLEATATPQDSPSSDLATIENVMGRNIARARVSPVTMSPMDGGVVEEMLAAAEPGSARIDWDRVEGWLGTALPADYRELAERFGS